MLRCRFNSNFFRKWKYIQFHWINSLTLLGLRDKYLSYWKLRGTQILWYFLFIFYYFHKAQQYHWWAYVYHHKMCFIYFLLVWFLNLFNVLEHSYVKCKWTVTTCSRRPIIFCYILHWYFVLDLRLKKFFWFFYLKLVIECNCGPQHPNMLSKTFYLFEFVQNEVYDYQNYFL